MDLLLGLGVFFVCLFFLFSIIGASGFFKLPTLNSQSTPGLTLKMTSLIWFMLCVSFFWEMYLCLPSGALVDLIPLLAVLCALSILQKPEMWLWKLTDSGLGLNQVTTGTQSCLLTERTALCKGNRPDHPLCWLSKAGQAAWLGAQFFYRSWTIGWD